MGAYPFRCVTYETLSLRAFALIQVSWESQKDRSHDEKPCGISDYSTHPQRRVQQLLLQKSFGILTTRLQNAHFKR